MSSPFVPRVFRGLLVSAMVTMSVVTPATLQAQSDILLRLRSGSPVGDRVRIDSAGGFLALGTIGVGIIPASGAGYRMMWHPQKVAFRAGYADAGLQMDESNIGYYSWAGGALNTAKGNYSFAMGNANLAEADCGIALGSANRVFGNATDGFATCGVAMGINNRVRDNAGVAMGQGNNSRGDAAFALGYFSTANADYSMAFGYRASTAGFVGAKVFGDASIADSILAIANNEFAVRAAGGFRFRTTANLVNGCNIPAGGTTITCTSSRTTKTNFGQIGGEDVLSRIATMPIMTWSFIEEPGNVKHVGPFAEDFYAAFGLGSDDKAIAIQDVGGINMLAIQALERRTTELAAARASADALAGRVTQLESANAELQQRLERLEAALGARRTP